VDKQKERTNHESTKGRKHEKKQYKFRAFKISCFRDEKNSNLTQNSRPHPNFRIGQLVADRLTQIWNCFGLAFDHVAAVVTPGRHILINPVIALYQFRESKITQFAV